jgi:hypothetical protein
MSTLPIEDLERQAVEERRELHQRANELKTKVRVARQNLDINRNARRHFGGAAAVLAGVGLLCGYAFGGLFTDR